MEFEAIIEVLRRRTGRDDLAPGADGRVRLEIEGVVSIDVGPAGLDAANTGGEDAGGADFGPGRVSLSSTLDELEGGALEGAVGLPRLRALLHANAAGSQVDAARLAMAPDGSVALVRMLDVHGEEALIEGVMAFMNLAAHWQTTGSDHVMSLGAMPRIVPLEDWDKVRLVRV